LNKETWSGALATFRSIRPWQIAVLIVVLLGAGAGTYLLYSSLTGSESTELEEDQQLIPVQRGDLVKEVSISGSVSFPNREVLTFGSTGIVDEVLVEEGERVVEGQKLATLDTETIAGLEEAAAKARVDLRDAEEALADYLEPPDDLQIAEARHKVAEAEVSLQTATEALEQTLKPTSVEVADAEAKIASLLLDLQNAEDKLADLLEPSSLLDLEKAQADVESEGLVVEDAMEALATLVEPPSDQDVAKAKSRVETARVALEKIKDELASLLEPPSDQDVAKAESRVETARIAMEKAEEDLASLLEPPSEQDIARAESRVETARVDLEKAKDELASFLEEPTYLEVVQAKWRIAQAELALQNAEDEHAAAWELDQLAVAEARSIVAKMELEAQNAKESLDELVQSPSDDDLEEANLALERAVSEGTISREELEVARRDRDIKLGEVNQRVTEAADDYALEFLEWLGMEVDPASIDPDPEVALAAFGIDLATLFDPSNQLPESPYIGIYREGFPRNDPSTPWNDFTVYAWLNLHFARVVGVCEPGNVPTRGHCVQDEFRKAGDAYQSAIDNFDSVDSQTARMVSEKVSAEEKARDELESAQQALVDILEPPDPLVVAQHEADLALARLKVTDARQALEDLLAPTDPFLVKEKEAQLASATLADAWQAYEELLAPADPIAIADKEMAVTLATVALADAQQALDDLLEPADPLAVNAKNAEIEAARVALVDAQHALADLFAQADPIAVAAREAEIEVASITLADEQQALADLLAPPDDQEVEKRNLDLSLAQIDLRKAEESLADLLETANDTTVSNQRSQIALIRVNIDQAEDDLAELKSGKDRSEHRARLEDVEGARLVLEQRREELADLEGQTPEQLDVALLETTVSSARAAVEQADRRLADSTLKAPSDGFVSQVNVEQGQRVEANASVLELVDTNVVEIDGSVDEIDVLSVSVGAEASVTMDALPGESIPGAVSFLGAEAHSQQGIVSYPIGVQLQAPDEVQLPEGLSAVATITIGRDIGVLLVPLQALRGSFDQPTLGVMVDGQIVETLVTLGSSDDFWTVVTDGVAEGDRIVMKADLQEDGFGGFGPRPRSGVTIRRVTR
jgi:RND family efflux transporter MFP subunit